MSWRYVVINKCIVSCLHIWKMVPLGVNLEIKYSISLFSILNRVAIWMYFAFKQGQNWRVLAPHTQPNFIPIPSSSPSPREKFLPLCITIIQQQNRFFSELNKKKRDGTEGAQFRPPLIQTWLTSHQHSEPQLELLTPQTLQLVRYQEKLTFCSLDQHYG